MADADHGGALLPAMVFLVIPLSGFHPLRDRSTSRLAVRMPDGDFFWNAWRTYRSLAGLIPPLPLAPRCPAPGAARDAPDRRAAAVPGHRSAGQTGCLESADDAAQDRHPRRTAMPFRAGPSASRAIPLSGPGRTVLPSSRRLLRTSIQGAVPCLEGGWRHRFCRLPITRAR